MKLADVKRAYLYEGLDNSSKKSMLLWESAGHAINEAQLTPQQITQLFQQVEKDLTTAGGNRTMLGKGKDVADAVKKAYRDLKGKVETSSTMQYFDQKYDETAAKLKQATGGDQGVMKYIEKYRSFAKAHPMAQSLIYGALIAAAGISGAGAGGAAALGLLKMTDKLLQGEKFSKAAIAGAETGAMAYAAGKIGQAMKGDATTTSSTIQQNTTGMQATWPTQGVVPSNVLKNFPPGSYEYMKNGDYWEVLDAAGNKMASFTVDSMNESISLTDEQVTALFETIVIEAGLWDKFKTQVLGEPEQRAEVGKQIKQGVAKAAGAVSQQAQRIGTNLTTKITADKLQKAWKAAGSPTDSDQLQKFLVAQGIDAGIIDAALKTITPATTSNLPDISKLSKQQLEQLLAMLEEPAAAIAPAETPAALQPSMTQLLKQRQAQGLGAYESLEFESFKTKLKEALRK